jgi:hypothetical protein
VSWHALGIEEGNTNLLRKPEQEDPAGRHWSVM